MINKATSLSNTIKTQTRGRRKLPTPLRPKEESGAESTLRTFPQLEEHSDDDLGTYSDEI